MGRLNLPQCLALTYCYYAYWPVCSDVRVYSCQQTLLSCNGVCINAFTYPHSLHRRKWLIIGLSIGRYFEIVQGGKATCTGRLQTQGILFNYICIIKCLIFVALMKYFNYYFDFDITTGTIPFYIESFISLKGIWNIEVLFFIQLRARKG